MRRLWRNYVRIGVIIMVYGGVMAFVNGCEQSAPPPPPTIEKTEPPQPTEKSTEEVAAEEKKPLFTYDPSGRREPFRSLIIDIGDQGPDPLATPGAIELISPLQQFEIKELKLTGIILGGLGDYATVIAPDSQSYTINVGAPVGKYEGKVVSISDNVVTIKEIFRYESGKIEEVETPLYLVPIKEEGKK